jgi:tryptophan synthase alpha chain
MVEEFRRLDTAAPVVLMGYANPIEAMGVESFVHAAAETGVDGVLVVDYPPEECAEFASRLRSAGIDPIFLLAPTSSEERVEQIARAGSGYIYYVALKGVTGARHIDESEIAARIPLLRSRLGMPVGVGFGIRDADSARRIAEVADAVVIGSRIIEEIDAAPPGEAPVRIAAFLSGIRSAMDKTATAGIP